MQVVSDTSPINYLLQIDGIGILPDLYGRIVVPNAVIAELGDAESPDVVRDWVELRILTRELLATHASWRRREGCYPAG